VIYQCRLSDQGGKIFQKQIEAQSPKELESEIENQGLFLISFKEEKPRGILRRRQHRAVLELTQSLSLMIQSGLSLKEAFEISSSLFQKGKTAQLVQQLNRQLQKGTSFSQAIALQGEAFPPLYQGMVEVGQRLGQLEKILEPLSLWLKERKELRDKILGALMYPAMVLILVFAGVSALLIFFLPQMENLALSAGQGAAQSLAQAHMAARGLIILFPSLLIMIPLLIITVKGLGLKNPAFALALDRLILSLPLIKSFILTREMLSLSFALSVLTQCGVSLEEGLEQAAGVLENRFLKSRILLLKDRLIKGDSLSSLLEKEKAFPAEFSRWTALGERIGKVDRVFTQLKQYYQQEMQKILNSLLTLAEPVVIMLLGIILLIIILKIVLPLLTLFGGMA